MTSIEFDPTRAVENVDPTEARQASSRAALRSRFACISENLHLVGLVVLMAGAAMAVASATWLYTRHSVLDGSRPILNVVNEGICVPVGIVGGLLGIALIATPILLWHDRKTMRPVFTALLALAAFVTAYVIVHLSLLGATSKETIRLLNGRDSTYRTISDPAAFNWTIGLGSMMAAGGGGLTLLAYSAYRGLRLQPTKDA